MDKKVLVYQSYGSAEHTEQTIFSIVSLLSWLTENDILEIKIYTDQKQAFTRFFGDHPRLKYREITKEEIRNWKGPAQYHHRLKIAMLKEASQGYKGPLFYCDSDTIFKECPMPLFRKVNERTSIMLSAESALDQSQDPVSKKVLAFVKKHHFQVRNELVGIGPSTVLWNAGNIGLCQTNKYLLDYILDLTDQTYALYKKSVMEQLAFSFFLQTRSEIIPTESAIHHYANAKVEFQSQIHPFLDENPTIDLALTNYQQFKWPSLRAKGKRSLIQKVLRRK